MVEFSSFFVIELTADSTNSKLDVSNSSSYKRHLQIGFRAITGWRLNFINYQNPINSRLLVVLNQNTYIDNKTSKCMCERKKL